MSTVNFFALSPTGILIFGVYVNTHESAENYLETILILKNELGRVRSADVVSRLGFSRASVSVAMKKLRDGGHVQMDTDGYIFLTESGQKIAESMYGRHTVLSSFLISLGVDEKTAINDACRIEHVISQQAFEKIRDAFRKGAGALMKGQGSGARDKN